MKTNTWKSKNIYQPKSGDREENEEEGENESIQISCLFIMSGSGSKWLLSKDVCMGLNIFYKVVFIMVTI